MHLSSAEHRTQGESPEIVGSGRRVLFIAPQPYFTYRGSPLRVRATLRALVELGFIVDLVVVPFGEDAPLSGLTIYRSLKIPGITSVPVGPSWRKLFLGAGLALTAGRVSFRHRYDIIHGVEEAGFIAGVLGWAHAVPYVFDLHSWMTHQLEYTGFIRSRTLLAAGERILRSNARRAAGIVTAGQENLDRARAVAPGVSVCALEDTPLDEASEVSPSAVASLRSELGLENRRVVLYTGNLAPYQGVSLLIESIGHLYNHCPELMRDVTTLIVGGGRLSERRELEEKAAALGILQNILFTGERPPREMGNFMALADVLVSPRTEGTNTPLKIYSYMAARRPIVATDILSHTQVLTPECAILAPPTPAAFSAALGQALSEPQTDERRHHRLEAAQNLVETTYSPRAFRAKLGSLYGEILARTAPRG